MDHLFKFLFTRFLVFRLGYGVKCHKYENNFVLTYNEGIKYNTSVFQSHHVESVIACSVSCSMFFTCCSASYDESKTVCDLYSVCYPQLKTDAGFIHIKRAPSTGITLPQDCDEIPTGSTSGIFTIQPMESLPVDVYCEFSSGVWTLIQRRIDGLTDFYLDWLSYKEGFGDKNHEFWIGNENLYAILNSKNYSLRIDIEAFDGATAWAEYTKFTIGDEDSKYRLTIGGYTGTAGNNMDGNIYTLNGMMFSTPDKDNDVSMSLHCARDSRMGGWWYRGCTASNPNGLYKSAGYSGIDSIHWRGFRNFDALKSISMKIRPQ